jgi:hypothetical protein
VNASIRTAILSRGRALGTETFSFVIAGGGKVGEGGGGLKSLFSLKLGRSDEEVLEDVEDTDKLVVRRSRMFINACIERQICPDTQMSLLRVSDETAVWY